MCFGPSHSHTLWGKYWWYSGFYFQETSPKGWLPFTGYIFGVLGYKCDWARTARGCWQALGALLAYCRLATPLLHRPACGIFQMAAQDVGISCMEHTPTDSEDAARLICWWLCAELWNMRALFSLLPTFAMPLPSRRQPSCLVCFQCSCWRGQGAAQTHVHNSLPLNLVFLFLGQNESHLSWKHRAASHLQISSLYPKIQQCREFQKNVKTLHLSSSNISYV